MTYKLAVDRLLDTSANNTVDRFLDKTRNAMRRIKLLIHDLISVIRRHYLLWRSDNAESRRWYCDISTAGYVMANNEEDAKHKAAAILSANLATGFASFTVYLEDEDVPPDEMIGFDDDPSGVVVDGLATKV
jgi:hypothetical protein